MFGNNVNVAVRLQGIAEPGGILISEATYVQVKDRPLVTSMAPMTLKGKRLPVGVYRIEGLRKT